MGMNLGGGGGKKKGVTPEMNVTPPVDVVLVLLIIFMVITPLLSKHFWILTPKQEKEEVEKQDLANDPEPPLVLRVAADKSINVNGTTVGREELADRLRRLVISHLAAGMRQQAAIARLQERQAAAMHGLNRQLVSTRGVEKIVELAVQYISEIFDCEVAALLPDENRKLKLGGGIWRR